jgi:enterochelin esterase-like enzyme/dienelactone hydrolase
MKRKAAVIFLAVMMIAALLMSCAAADSGDAGSSDADSGSGHFNKDTRIETVKNESAFGDWGRLIFPADESYYSGSTLGSLELTWYTNIDPDKTVEIANYFYDETKAGEQVFYDIYSDKAKAADPEKKDTGIFFFRGKPGAKTAIVSAGGGFAYVGAMQDSFPVALELSKKGYNAVALIYRPEEQTAYEDLAHAIAWLERHADELDIDMTDYSLWGGSAGARMADRVGTAGTRAFGEKKYPRPAAVITQYTGLTRVTGWERPTYANVGTDDPIADWHTMKRRIRRIRANGTDAKIEVFKDLSHGFGLGTGTDAEGWVSHAASFWKKHMKHKTKVKKTTYVTNRKMKIPNQIAEIPDGWKQPASARTKGTLVEVKYKTDEALRGDTRLTKRAIVYLPHGYDPDKKYDVFYLMHGGWSDETTTLGTPSSPTTFKNVLDNAIAHKKIRPLIVVCPTYNNTNEDGRDSDDFSLALQLTRRYHNELVNDLMPAVESRYSTYAKKTTPAGFAASRNHRGFGGFSMGSVATWRTFQYCLDDFRYFLPMSCGTDLNDKTIWKAAAGRKQSDYYVFIMTGTQDFAYSYEKSRTAAMEKSKYFTRTRRSGSKTGNFAFRVKKGYSHDGNAAMEYTYNGLAAFFPPVKNN